MAEGWVKLHRRFLTSSIWKNQNLSRFWTWCLLKASHSSVKTRVRYIEVELSPGQFVFGRLKAAEETGLSEDEVRTCVKALKAENAITITNHSTRQFSIVTILNWKGYQHEEKKEPQPFAGEAPTYPQPVPTNNNDQDVKETTKFVCERDDSPTGTFEGQFDSRRPEILDAWKSRRVKAGLEAAVTQRDKTTASNVLLALDAGDYTREQLFTAMDNLMANEEWRSRYSFQGFVNDLPRWLDRKKSDDHDTPRNNGSGKGQNAGTRLREAPKGKYAHIDVLHFGTGN